jgi:ATP-dependent DNA ligase
MAKQPRFAGVEYPIRPMAAVPADALPDDQPGIWALETKLDGWRCLAMHDRGRVVLQSRQQRPLSRYFPEVVAAVRELGVDAVFDGELVAWTDGHLDFAALQQRIHPSAARARRMVLALPACLVVFDLLARKGTDFRDRPTPSAAASWRSCWTAHCPPTWL